MKLRALLVVTMCFFAANTAFAQSETYDDTHLFQTFFEDASVNRNTYLQPFFSFSDFDGANALQFGAQVMFPIDGRFQLGGELSIINIDTKYGDGETGISDLKFVGRYSLETGRTKVALGGYLTLPTGKAEVGQDNVNFGFFGAVRHPLANRLALTGTAMLEFIETVNRYGKNDHKAGLVLAGGLIYQASSTVDLIGELDIKTAGDRSMFSAGVDYSTGGGRLRGGLGLGLDDGAPDIMLFVGYLISFN
ncbi:MAG: hypothetical protein HGB19_12190 [Chlorobiales bacterium]|nr:hypothetical protein [Chlorobiales bacterium]